MVEGWYILNAMGTQRRAATLTYGGQRKLVRVNRSIICIWKFSVDCKLRREWRRKDK